MHYKENEFRRMVLKATRFPVVMKYEQHTVRKNRWKVMFKAFNRRNTLGRAAILFYCINESEIGKFVYLVRPFPERGRGRFQTMIFKPHFFKRYRERLGLVWMSSARVSRLTSHVKPRDGDAMAHLHWKGEEQSVKR